MRVRKLPDQKYLLECFTIKDDVLYWLERPLHHFKNKAVQSRTNTKYSGKQAGHLNKLGYISIRLDNKLYQSHRIIYKLVHNIDPYIVDHIDRNKTNNNVSNLRNCTQQINVENSTVTNYKGSLCPNNKYRVRVRYKRKVCNVGVFNTFEAAEKTYDMIRNKINGKDLTPAEVSFIVMEIKQTLKEGK